LLGLPWKTAKKQKAEGERFPPPDTVVWRDSTVHGALGHLLAA
jgi:hypothetical protein